MRRRTAVLALGGAMALHVRAAVAAGEPVLLKARDGVPVHGRWWPAAGRGPLILAFHQAGSSHAEYLPLVPRLHAAGCGVLAIDQRSGGGEFGGRNATVAALGRSGSYESALPDLEAALAWGRQRAAGAPVLAWGSSYSAALVFLLAAAHPGELAAVLAFSPGEYLADPRAVRKAAAAVQLPLFVTQSADEDEIAASREILKASGSRDQTLFLPRRGGAHGSATLRRDRNASGADEVWSAAEAFLARFRN